MELNNIKIKSLLNLFNVNFDLSPNLTDIEKHTGNTYAHTCKLVKIFKNKGMFRITVNKSNKRSKVVSLTPKGEEVKAAIDVLRRNF